MAGEAGLSPNSLCSRLWAGNLVRLSVSGLALSRAVAKAIRPVVAGFGNACSNVLTI